MSDLIYAQRFGIHYFEIKRSSFISARKGRVSIRDNFYLNGKRVSQKIWRFAKRAATITPEEAAEAAAREARLQATFRSLLDGTF